MEYIIARGRSSNADLFNIWSIIGGFDSFNELTRSQDKSGVFRVEGFYNSEFFSLVQI